MKETANMHLRWGGFVFHRQLIAAAASCAIYFSGMTFAIEAATAYQGYTFCACGQTAYLLNPSGTQVHTWKAAGSARSCAYLLPDGSALFPIQSSCIVRGDGASAQRQHPGK
jgi:hypothetical protein